MSTNKESSYTIPARYRRMENSHILFWLLKDISWCVGLKIPGILMVFPTLIVSIVIAWRTRSMISELAHNLAVTFWIVANSYWMIAEFYGFDEVEVFAGIEGRYLALIPFCIGALILVYYYLFVRLRHRNEDEVTTEAEVNG